MTAIDEMKIPESLLKDVMQDIENDSGCKGCSMHRDGCVWKRANGPRPFHQYCDKLKWILERAQHYGEKTNLPPETILEQWESDRTDWYMNRYQDAHQPLIDGEYVHVYETIDECRKGIGTKFRCPNCKKTVDDPQECPLCHWKSYGLLSSGYHVFLKDKGAVIPIFKPLTWEEREKAEGTQ